MLLRIPMTKKYFVFSNSSKNEGWGALKALVRLFEKLIPNRVKWWPHAYVLIIDYDNGVQSRVRGILEHTVDLDHIWWNICRRQMQLRDAVRDIKEQKPDHHQDVPKIIVLDNAFDGLDEATRDWVLENYPDAYYLIVSRKRDVFACLWFIITRVIG